MASYKPKTEGAKNKYSTACLLTKDRPNIEHNLNDKYSPAIVFPVGENRKGEGGLRTQGYFKHDLLKKPLVTIVTAVYNGEKHLEETIQSVINQTYENVEYIIIDGGSTDGTLDIIKRYDGVINYWISECDRGISDAFNKAVTVSMGSYINFQGDGDGFYDKHAIENIMRDIDSSRDMLVSAKIIRIDENGNELFISKQPDSFSKRSLLFKMPLPHQGLFTNQRLFKKYGLFDINNKYCMDYEHLLRAYNDFPKVILKNIIVSKWRYDGLGHNKEMDIFREYDAIKRHHKVSYDFVLLLINYWTVLKFKLKNII